ncbi:MAG: hypothetical protein QF752_12435 [Planctomycetota bacterium]|nr:hypothetical protein [Planctomycetota bacterium]
MLISSRKRTGTPDAVTGYKHCKLDLVTPEPFLFISRTAFHRLHQELMP